MEGVRIARRTGGLAIVAMFWASFGWAPAAAAAEPPSSQVLPGSALTAVTADVDGDGSAEVVRLTSGPASQGFGIDVWTLDGDEWVMAGRSSLARSDPEGEPTFDGTYGTLLTWRVDGHDRVLAVTATARFELETPPTPCCFEMAEITGAGGEVDLLPRWSDKSGADTVHVADLDGDGTDELVTQLTRYVDDPESWFQQVAILRWTDDGFVRLFETEWAGDTFPVLIGDSDGVAGDEVVIGPNPVGEMHRIVLSGSDVRVEDGRLEPVTGFEGWPVGVAAGTTVVQARDGLLLMRWPPGGEPTVVDRLRRPTAFAVAVLGSGEEALILTQESPVDGPPVTTVRDLALRRLGEVTATSIATDTWEIMLGGISGGMPIERNLFPYSGILPGGLDGRVTYATNGALVVAGGPDGFESRPVSPFIGSAPLGGAGPGDTWMALSDAYFGFGPGGSYLIPSGSLPEGVGRITLVPTEEVLAADAGGLVSIEPEGAVADGDEGLIAPGDGFSAVVTAPPGALVIITDRRSVQEHEVIDEPIVIEVRPRRNAPNDRNVDFDRTLLVMLPSGHVSAVAWEGTFVRVPPALTAEGTTRTFAPAATVAGRAEGAASVTVNGVAAKLDPDGAFAIDIEAPIWPHEVVVVARDLVGNATTTRLEVVGVFDYRGLPWVPILGAATAGAALVLFVRTPRVRRQTSPAWGDDATFEDIDQA